MRVISCDIETEGLVNPQYIWVCVTKEPYKQPRIWTNLHVKSNQAEFVAFLREEPTIIVGHNFLGFDLDVLRSHIRDFPTELVVRDTLVLSRLFNSFAYRTHALEDWGERLGYRKIHFKDFSRLTDEMITYCVRDVEIVERLWFLWKRYIDDEQWQPSIQLEHDSFIILREAKENGFGFDIEAAHKLHKLISKQVNTLEKILQAKFPPAPTLVRTIQPVLTKTGKLHSKDFRWLEGKPEDKGYSTDVFSLIEYTPFNPGSTKQVIDKLWMAGWQPTETTKGHAKAIRAGEVTEEFKRYGWTVSEENLDTLPKDAPKEFRFLTKYLSLSRRVSTLTEWINAYNPHTGRIHGTIHAIGTWTHRCSHTNPNQGNIPRITSLFGKAMRSLWRADPGKFLIGVDAEGIQLRVLAHYMEDESFTKALVSGKKENETDVHSINRVKLGRTVCQSRDDAKTFIYSWVLGASAPKTAKVLKCSVGEAVVARTNFLEGYPGLKKVKEELIPKDVARQWFRGFDGRKVVCDSAHKMLAGYLQNGEVIIMKWAMRLWYNKLKKEGVPFKLVDFVHDEWQTETTTEQYAEYIKAVQIWSIEQAGVELGLKCPMAGSGSIGKNWRDTH